MTLRFDAGEVITAMVTPFNEKREIDFSAVEKLAKHLADTSSDVFLWQEQQVKARLLPMKRNMSFYML